MYSRHVIDNMWSFSEYLGAVSQTLFRDDLPETRDRRLRLLQFIDELMAPPTQTLGRDLRSFDVVTADVPPSTTDIAGLGGNEDNRTTDAPEEFQ